MSKLGYTWYTKDWRSNMKVSELSLQEKGFYRELIDECFLKNSSKIQINERTFCRLHGINSRTFAKVLQKLHESLLIVIENFDETIISIPSTNKRLGVIKSAKSGGESNSKNGEKKVTKLKEKYKEKENINKDLFFKTPKGKHLFVDSPYYDFEHLRKKLKEADDLGVDLNYYYNQIKDWSESNGQKKVNWSAVCSTWMRNDKAKNKLQMKKDDLKIKQDEQDMLDFLNT